MLIKRQIKQALHNLGYEVHRVRDDEIGRDPFEDMRRLAASDRPAVLFDVGANHGQTLSQFRKSFPYPLIHAFEPNALVFRDLVKQMSGVPGIFLNNLAVGSVREQKVLLQSPQDTVSSFLPPGKDYSWKRTTVEIPVEVTTLDHYCESAGIRFIDVLKSDTQGYDYEVLKGAANLLRDHRVRLIFVELNFLDLYIGMARFESMYNFLRTMGFEPISFYNLSWQNSRLGWLDGLFIDPLFNSG